jgi:hypothetical protein
VTEAATLSVCWGRHASTPPELPLPELLPEAPPDDDELPDIPPDELLDGPPEELLDPPLLEDELDVPLDDPFPDDPPLDDVPEDPPLLELSPPELVEPYT